MINTGDDARTPRQFSMVAYNGGEMRVWFGSPPVVIDLAGLKTSKKSRPILRDHMSSQIVGHTTEITNTKSSLKVAGVLSILDNSK